MSLQPISQTLKALQARNDAGEAAVVMDYAEAERQYQLAGEAYAEAGRTYSSERMYNLATACRRLQSKFNQPPPGYKIMNDGIMDPFYAIKDDDFGTIVSGTLQTREAAIHAAWIDYKLDREELT